MSTHVDSSAVRKNKERYKIIPEVFLFFIENEKILLSRRFQTGYEDGKYGLPGGHGEYKETVREGAAREALEEIGVTIEAEDLKFALVQYRWCPDRGNHHARVGFYFNPVKFIGTPHNKEPQKCDDLRYFSLKSLPVNMVPHVRAAVEAYVSEENYNEFNWEMRPDA